MARLPAWDAELRREYARACALRARDLALPALPPDLREGGELARRPEEIADRVEEASARLDGA